MNPEAAETGAAFEPDREFWGRVARAGRKLLALDYDGVLAPFREQRMEARPLPGIIEALAEVRRDPATEVAVVSGRPLAELDLLLGPLARELLMAGAHGWEIRRPGRPVETLVPDPQLQAALDRAHRSALQLAREEMGEAGPGRIERKAASAAAHVRGIEPQMAARFLERLATEWNHDPKTGLELMAFDGGLELRASARDKGVALRELIQAREGLEFTVYVGDDLTDEDAFRILQGAGAGIKVGRLDQPTAAGYRLQDVESVRDFLMHWARESGRRTGEDQA